MPYMRIGKSYTFDAAHQLEGHMGKCRNLHGHTYTVEVWLKGSVYKVPGATDDGMVMDYGELDSFVKPIIDAMDHSFLTNDYESTYLALILQGTELKYFHLGARTTAENIATYIGDALVKAMPSNIKTLGVRVSETPKSFAEYVVRVDQC
jgi:6-pyruvoyltetrahydropterin/6-carboxytetrahydropterin synthase